MPDKNYIVSGLERSGTSLMMQVLKAGGIPIAYDEERKPDKNNPEGYYELFGGKIISKLEKGEVDLNQYKGKFIKVTAYGLLILPPGEYKVIYMVRNYSEVVKSSYAMRSKIKDEELRVLESAVRAEFLSGEFDVLEVGFKEMIEKPKASMNRIGEELLKWGFPTFDWARAKKVINPKLYRMRS